MSESYEPGTEKWRSAAQAFVAKLEKLRQDLGLPALARATTPEAGVLFWAKVTEWGYQLRVTGGTLKYFYIPPLNALTGPDSGRQPFFGLGKAAQLPLTSPPASVKAQYAPTAGYTAWSKSGQTFAQLPVATDGTGTLDLWRGDTKLSIADALGFTPDGGYALADSQRTVRLGLSASGALAVVGRAPTSSRLFTVCRLVDGAFTQTDVAPPPALTADLGACYFPFGAPTVTDSLITYADNTPYHFALPLTVNDAGVQKYAVPSYPSTVAVRQFVNPIDPTQVVVTWTADVATSNVLLDFDDGSNHGSAVLHCRWKSAVRAYAYSTKTGAWTALFSQESTGSGYSEGALGGTSLTTRDARRALDAVRLLPPAFQPDGEAYVLQYVPSTEVVTPITMGSAGSVNVNRHDITDVTTADIARGAEVYYPGAQVGAEPAFYHVGLAGTAVLRTSTSGGTLTFLWRRPSGLTTLAARPYGSAMSQDGRRLLVDNSGYSARKLFVDGTQVWGAGLGANPADTYTPGRCYQSSFTPAFEVWDSNGSFGFEQDSGLTYHCVARRARERWFAEPTVGSTNLSISAPEWVENATAVPTDCLAVLP